MDPTFHAACEAAAETWHVPALVVCVRTGETESTVAVGCDEATRFRVASVTKPFTAMLALALLDLDEAPGVWAADVRLRHLLAHTSGYDCELAEPDLARFGGGDDALPRAVAELPTVRRWLGVDEVWSYSNAGYWLAGWQCAERAGGTFEQALAERVLRPAALEATDFGEPDVPGTGPEADAGPYPRARRPSGGLVSTAGDLVRFGRRLLESADAARMRAPCGKPVGGVYGLGLAGERVAAVDVWGHAGSYGGFQSSLLLVPDRGAVFAGLTNSGHGKQALRLVEDAFFERVVGAPRRTPPTAELPAASLEALAGTYANREGWYEVEPDGGGLVLLADGEEHPARAIGPATFEVTAGPLVRDRFDFPREGFLRVGGRLAERLA
ncbi:MAG TPA: serine hydrolase domain-containing protein [Gaiellaceae bacterium]|nr:serine hydrolase domain-containing protein [Gaiellaceae bacterium]